MTETDHMPPGREEKPLLSLKEAAVLLTLALIGAGILEYLGY